jgi:hypothetical protein
VAQPGARAFLELFNRIGMAALPAWLKGMKLPGYRTGGYVTPPRASNAGMEEMIPAVFNFPGVGKVPAQVTPSVADELAKTLKIEALMRGRRGPSVAKKQQQPEINQNRFISQKPRNYLARLHTSAPGRS